MSLRAHQIPFAHHGVANLKSMRLAILVIPVFDLITCRPQIAVGL